MLGITQGRLSFSGKKLQCFPKRPLNEFRLASKIGLHRQVREEAAMLYRRAVQDNLVRGRSVEGVAAAALYGASAAGRGAHQDEPDPCRRRHVKDLAEDVRQQRLNTGTTVPCLSCLVFLR